MKELGPRVPAIGPRDAKIMIVGEGPGAVEERKGEPFLGDAGRELDKVLRMVGVPRSDCFLTNITKHRPNILPKDDFFFNNGAPTSVYMDGIIELIGEIKEVKPNVVAALGNYALWGLTQKKKMLSRRGSIMESSLVPGQKVVATLHPAWILHTRQFEKRPLLEWDWMRIAAESQFPEIHKPPHTFVVSPTPEEMRDAEERLLSAALITVDTEWYSPDKLAYIGFADSAEWAITFPQDSMLAHRICAKILKSDVPKVMQHAMFDAVALSRVGFDVRNTVHDTMVGWNALYGDIKKKDLGTICSVLTKWEYYKDHVEFVGKDDAKGQQYCCTDCVVTHSSMEEMLNTEFNIIPGSKRGYDISMSIMDTFIRASKIGTRADISLLKQRREETLARATERMDALNEKIGYSINVRSHVQVKQLVYDELGVSRKKRSSEQTVLMDIAASTHNQELKGILTDIIHIRKDLKRCSNYLNENIIDDDGRVRCTWNLAGTKNGRLSTTKPWWNGVAIQTFPWEDRDVFIADPGHTFIGWDLEQAEARVVAVLSHDYNLLDDLAGGIDIHTKLASQLPFNMTYEQLLAKIAEVGKDDCDERNLSKTCRHAMNYYLTWAGLKARVNKEYIDTGVGIDAARAKELRAAYIMLSPGLEGWWDEVYHEMGETMMMTNAHGRIRRFIGKLIQGQHLHRDGIAYYPQSTIGDHTSLAIAAMDEAMPYGQPLAHMHDGGYIQVPDATVDDAIEIMRTETNKEILVKKETILVPSELKVGPNWKDMKKVA